MGLSNDNPLEVILITNGRYLDFFNIAAIDLHNVWYIHLKNNLEYPLYFIYPFDFKYDIYRVKVTNYMYIIIILK